MSLSKSSAFVLFLRHRTDVSLLSPPAYNYSVENQTLMDALERQQSRVHHIYSTIAGDPLPTYGQKRSIRFDSMIDEIGPAKTNKETGLCVH